MPISVVFIHGPAAAGKHTVGSLVSDKLGIPLFHNHLTVDLVKTLFEFGTEGFKRLRADIWIASFKAACEAQRSFVFTFNPENTMEPGLIHELVSLVANAGGVVHYIELVCSEEEIARRIGNESRSKFGKLTDAAIYKEFKLSGGFDFPSLPTPLVTIDTAVFAPEVAAKKIVDALNQ